MVKLDCSQEETTHDFSQLIENLELDEEQKEEEQEEEEQEEGAAYTVYATEEELALTAVPPGSESAHQEAGPAAGFLSDADCALTALQGWNS